MTKPRHEEADGYITEELFPNAARLRNLTYARLLGLPSCAPRSLPVCISAANPASRLMLSCALCSYESKIQIDVHWQLFEKETDTPLTDEMKSSEFFGEVTLRVLTAAGLCSCDGF